MPEIDPVAVEIGPLAVRWYGLMYVIGFAAALVLGTRRARRKDSPMTPAQFQDLAFYAMVGLVIGARLGYMIFYDSAALIRAPLEIIKVWHGGMSFHGGLLGIGVAGLVFAKRNDIHFLDLGDFVAPLAPPGLFAGRIGNFINAELWGRPSDVPWAMVFPGPAAGPFSRHPSQLYEALLEGAVLFFILWFFSRQPRPRGMVLGLFLLLYGLFRFLVEFFRQPDIQLGFVALDFLTMGQLLSLPMAIIGSGFIARAYCCERKNGGPV
ncbi:MAG: prolipoprotein diacylglyceryl transferase [Desulfobacterales bacterium]|nr:prolipoprotein diacylglyceryl transferase [Desulfobacterales bacterium]